MPSSPWSLSCCGLMSLRDEFDWFVDPDALDNSCEVVSWLSAESCAEYEVECGVKYSGCDLDCWNRWEEEVGQAISASSLATVDAGKKGDKRGRNASG